MTTVDFSRCFLFPGQLREAVKHCKPVFSIDACHLKNGYQGILTFLTATSGDGKLLSVAMDLFANNESDSVWSYFLEWIRRALPELDPPQEEALKDKFVLIHDRNQSLIIKHAEVLPRTFKADCPEHIKRNIKTKFGITADMR